MKKCKLVLAEGETKTKYFYLLPEASLLHTLVRKSTEKSLITLLKNHPEVEVVSLKRGQWIEVEWNGCDVSYSKEKHTSASFVRLAKAANIARNKDSTLLSVHFGWVLSDHIKMINRINEGVQTTVMSTEEEQFNFSELFQDNETTEDMLKKAELQNMV